MKKQILSAAVALSFIASPSSAQQGADVMVVFDTSGSMWGQIDGVTKIEIAREAFEGLTDDWADMDTNVGLIAYGHRRKGDCSDIELIVAPEAGSTGRLSALIQELTPRGKTPLSDAVVLAAETLKFSENSATVVLLSDGRETCGANTCEVGAELARIGVNFTAHVIGFDVNDVEARNQLQCLAQTTGGQYFDANDAGGLSEALRQISSLETPATVPEEIVLKMVPLQIGIAEQDGTARPVQVSLRATNMESGEVLVIGSLKGAAEILNGLNSELSEGRWLVEAVSEEGTGAIEVVLEVNSVEIDVPFAAFPLDFKLADTGPYLLGVDHTFLLTPIANIQKNAQLVVGMFPAGSRDYGQRMDYSFQFGAVAGQVLEVRFDTPPAAGDYDIVVMMGNDLNDVFFRQTVTYATDVEPSWQGLRHGQAGGRLPILIGGVTNPYATVELQLDGQDVWDDWFQDIVFDEGAFLPLPSQDGVYSIVYTYKNADGDRISADLGTLSVGEIALEDDTDAVEPPAAKPVVAESIDANPQYAYLCDNDLCAQSAGEFGLNWVLSKGWVAEEPYYYSTAGGVVAELPSMDFVALNSGAEPFIASLNPHQWSASNGPCLPVAQGELCYIDPLNDAESSAFATLLASLREVELSDTALNEDDISRYFKEAQGGSN